MPRLLDVNFVWNLSRDTVHFRGLQCWGIGCVIWKLVMPSALILDNKRLSFLALDDCVILKALDKLFRS